MRGINNKHSDGVPKLRWVLLSSWFRFGRNDDTSGQVAPRYDRPDQLIAAAGGKKRILDA
jgi:hypothetical protein